MNARLTPKGFSTKLLKDRRGILSVDFLFAMAISGVLCMMMFAFSTTMAMIQIAQYIAFSTARVHAAGHISQDKQFNQAKDKFKTFSEEKHFRGLAPLLRNGWFEIDQGSLQIRGGGDAPGGGGGGDFNAEYGHSPRAIPQQGVRFVFKAPVLKFNIPLISSVSDEDDNDFGTVISGMIFREPTSEECSEQMRENIRFRALRDLDGRYRDIYTSGMHGGRHTPTASSYVALEDNGC